MTTIRYLSTVATLLLLTTGCGSNDWPEVAPVRGTVTNAGKPVPNAALGFQSAGAPRYGYGTTDAAGRYTLSTFEPGDGAIIGDHVVVIRPGKPNVEHPDIQALDMSEPKNDAAYKKAFQAASRPNKKTLVPARYGSPDTTPLKATVKPGDNVIDFDLSKD